MREEDARRGAEQNPCERPDQRARSIEVAGATAVFYGVFGGRPVPLRQRLLYHSSHGTVAVALGPWPFRPYVRQRIAA